MAQIHSACKTEQQAIDALNYEGYEHPYITWGDDVRCMCGMTACLIGLSVDDKPNVRVAICDMCGLDDAWIDEVVVPVKQVQT